MEGQKRERIWYWDILRIAAVIFLVIRHISTASFEFVEPLGTKWWVFNVYGSLAAWMVPVYLMLSGASFLDPEKKVTVQSIWSRNILRMFTAFAAWSVIYAAYNHISGQDTYTSLVEMLFTGHFHLWFLPMIMGIYMMLPLFRLASRTTKGTLYIFSISLVISVAFPMLQDLGWAPDAELITGMNNVGFISSHVCFFFAGRLFHKIDLTKKQRYVLYTMGIAATLAVFIGTWQLTLQTSVHNEDMQSDSNLLTGIQGIALFVLVKQLCKGKQFGIQTQNALKFYSSLTFGVYLVHVMFIAMLDRFGFSPITYNAGWMIPLAFFFVTPLSFLTTWILRKIPVAGKYIT